MRNRHCTVRSRGTLRLSHATCASSSFPRNYYCHVRTRLTPEYDAAKPGETPRRGCLDSGDSSISPQSSTSKFWGNPTAARNQHVSINHSHSCHVFAVHLHLRPNKCYCQSLGLTPASPMWRVQQDVLSLGSPPSSSGKASAVTAMDMSVLRE